MVRAGKSRLPSRGRVILNFRNNLLLLHKNLPAADLRGALLRRRLLDTVAWAKFILTLDLPNASAILRAHRDFRRMRREYTAHPSDNLLARSADRRSRRPDILLSYFIKRKRHYSQL